jgi:hypothetical protein
MILTISYCTLDFASLPSSLPSPPISFSSSSSLLKVPIKLTKSFLENEIIKNEKKKKTIQKKKNKKRKWPVDTHPALLVEPPSLVTPKPVVLVAR